MHPPQEDHERVPSYHMALAPTPPHLLLLLKRFFPRLALCYRGGCDYPTPQDELELFCLSLPTMPVSFGGIWRNMLNFAGILFPTTSLTCAFYYRKFRPNLFAVPVLVWAILVQVHSILTRFEFFIVLITRDVASGMHEIAQMGFKDAAAFCFLPSARCLLLQASSFRRKGAVPRSSFYYPDPLGVSFLFASVVGLPAGSAVYLVPCTFLLNLFHRRRAPGVFSPSAIAVWSKTFMTRFPPHFGLFTSHIFTFLYALVVLPSLCGNTPDGMPQVWFVVSASLSELE